MRRAIAVVIVAAVVASACSGDSSSDAPITSATGTTPITDVVPVPRTVDEFLGTAEAPTKDELLSVFALLFGDVPGVQASELDASEVTTSRTWLVNAVTSHLSEYTPEQQAAITALVVPDLASPPASGLMHPATVPTGEVELQALVGELVTELEGRTGYSYPHSSPRVVVVDRDDVEGDGTWAMALAGSDLIDTGSSVYVLDQFGPTSEMECTIYIGTLATSLTINVLREKLLHEVFHCFQYAYFHLDISYFAALGGWRTEGTAAWVGLESVGGGTTGIDSWWRLYLQGNTTTLGTYSLTNGNGYSAVGFWSFLAQRGVDVWHLVLPQLNQATQGQAFHFVTGDSSELLSEWASSATQNGWSSAWSMTGTQITADHRSARALDFGAGAAVEATVPNLSNGVVAGNVASGTEYAIIGVAGVGIVSWDGEHERPLIDRAQRYCFLGEDCLCPDGRPPFGGAPFDSVEPTSATVGFGSISSGPTKVVLQGFTKADVCEECEGSSASGLMSGPLGAFEGVGECPDPCLNGKWVQDNGVMLQQFNNLTSGLPIIDSAAEGESVFEFDRGHLRVTYGHTFIIHIAIEDVGVMEQREAFAGPTELDYHAFAGFFEGFNNVSSFEVTSTVSIEGRTGSTATHVGDGGLGAATYTCLGNDLVITNVSFGIVTSLHRVNPTE